MDGHIHSATGSLAWLEVENVQEDKRLEHLPQIPGAHQAGDEAMAAAARPVQVPPRTGHRTLLYSEPVTNLEGLKADIAILGMPFGRPYSARSFTNDQTNAPQAIRDVTDRMVRAPEHFDFDIEAY
jgi:hypothetical protein